MRVSPLLLFHISAGTIGLLSGAAAVFFRKGSTRHRGAGNVFVISMLGLSASGAYIGFMRHQELNGLMGILTFYLVTTAWLTARRRDTEKDSIVDLGVLMVPLAVAAALAMYGLDAANSQTGSKGGFPAQAYFIFGSLALLLAAGDIRMIVRGGVSGARRIARHLRRMCLALFIAAGSLFLGQPQVFPAALRKTHVLFLLSILPLILMIFWLVRVRFTNAYKSMSTPAGGNVSSLRA
jgi:uncharacterized membrane protein